MRRLPLLILVSMVLAPILLRGQQPAQTPPVPTFRSSAVGVQISVIVTDEAGAPVAGLTQDDFEIVENGEDRPITTFTAVDIPVDRSPATARNADVLSNDGPPGRLYVIALDDMSAENALRSRSFLRNFIEKYFGPNDTAAVILTTRGGADAGQEFTRNPQLLLSAIDRFPGGTTADSLWMREKSFVDAFGKLVNLMAPLPAARKALILVSSNIPGDADLLRNARTSRIGRMFSETNPAFYDAVSMATRHNISVYPVHPAGLTTETPSEFDTSALEDCWSLSALARMTGGFALVGSNNYDDAFARLVRENSTYYSLGFNAGEEKGTFSNIQVRVRRPGLRTQTLEGYLAPAKPADLVKRPTTVLAAAWDAVASPVTSSGVQIRMFAAPYRAKGSSAAVAVTLEIATNRLNLVERDGAYRGDLEILFAVTDKKGKKRFQIMRHRATFALKPDTYARVSSRALRVLSELSLPAGRYQLRASAGSDAIAGSVVYDIEIPDFRDDFSLSGVAITSSEARETVTITSPGRFAVAFPGPPTTAREFSRSDVLTVFAEAYENRKKAHTMQLVVELRNAAGEVLDRFETERTPANTSKESGVYPFAPNLALADVPPGAYTLHVQATSSLERKPIMRSVPITVR